MKDVKPVYFYDIYCFNPNKCTEDKGVLLLETKLKEYQKVTFLRSEQKPQIVFLLGGDGSFINFVNQQWKQNWKIVGINYGQLGFYSSYDGINTINIDEIVDESMYANAFLIEVNINNENKFYCLNELSIFSNELASCDISINNTFYEKFRGSGLLFATPSGSTGKNKVAHGPIIFNNQPCFSMLEIFPVNHLKYSSLNAPVVFGKDYQISLTNIKFKRTLNLVVDGNNINFNNKIDFIEVKLIQASLQIHGLNNYKKYIERLRRSFIKEE
ncbi:NAD(+)/NADH kinase [Ureaplasma urealyticum]|uniref:NAD(+)/NADH kinase n=3 Tax=Ureaplasma urealyticum TaxID=2130 RepID=A0AAP9A9Q6_UREUR|nr:NAD(+)/NADH kinase [Ureaplasma urealyticum]EDX53814.1 NAD(+)/NADH kinase family protein [Ureaplasma urealyticum serovar 9 str. ATCC 33175]ACI60129.1 NAD(+)/NADH kinase family protein [Ureaplasma urealyticum serovar 10 str. ATCC 33699]EDU06391.1 NAD(+)/NADH kinase family protein [Ureaplasma urealyticum serovar 5 str. ATCC 27817]EDU56927.1 NAD(+)/NADH kinase family protein [Ureaplasma urealyticum serovar 7 str. ATCC 27819]EDU67037.1 NAD(+)/NADH kinase family protein [Ureaplasma urealyticum se